METNTVQAKVHLRPAVKNAPVVHDLGTGLESSKARCTSTKGLWPLLDGISGILRDTRGL